MRNAQGWKRADKDISASVLADAVEIGLCLSPGLLQVSFLETFSSSFIWARKVEERC